MKHILIFTSSVMGIAMAIGLASTGNLLFSVGLGAVGLSLVNLIVD